MIFFLRKVPLDGWLCVRVQRVLFTKVKTKRNAYLKQGCRSADDADSYCSDGKSNTNSTVIRKVILLLMMQR